MEVSKFVALARKFNCVLFEESGLLQGSKPLMVAGRMVGLVRPELLPLVRAAPIFQLVDGAVTLDPALETPETRSQAVADLLHRWRAVEDLPALRGWRDECYDVRASFSSPLLLRMERSATSLFGIRQYGVDLNGYTHHPEKGFCVWIQRRSLQKPTWPGKLDNMVSGGLTSGLSPLEAVRKEAWEEAGIPDHLLSHITSTGAVSLFYRSERGLFPNTEFVFDLELPADFAPQPQDGEVAEFRLVPVQVPARSKQSRRRQTRAPNVQTVQPCAEPTAGGGVQLSPAPMEPMRSGRLVQVVYEVTADGAQLICPAKIVRVDTALSYRRYLVSYLGWRRRYREWVTDAVIRCTTAPLKRNYGGQMLLRSVLPPPGCPESSRAAYSALRPCSVDLSADNLFFLSAARPLPHLINDPRIAAGMAALRPRRDDPYGSRTDS